MIMMKKIIQNKTQNKIPNIGLSIFIMSFVTTFTNKLAFFVLDKIYYVYRYIDGYPDKRIVSVGFPVVIIISLIGLLAVSIVNYIYNKIYYKLISENLIPSINWKLIIC